MASMASAASGFVLTTPNVATTANTGSVSSRSTVSFFYLKNKNNNNNRGNTRLVVRAAEEGAAPPAATKPPPPEGGEGEAPKPKPPPIGPKRGTKVSSPHIYFVTSFHVPYYYYYFLIYEIQYHLDVTICISP